MVIIGLLDMLHSIARGEERGRAAADETMLVRRCGCLEQATPHRRPLDYNSMMYKATHLPRSLHQYNRSSCWLCTYKRVDDHDYVLLVDAYNRYYVV